jgi:4-hydroxy-tetrahydrodipicolinate synthase
MKARGGENMSIFTGAGVALITPMKDNGDVNFDKLQELVNFQIDNGTKALIICGTTGEASTLSHEEHLEVIRASGEFAKKRVPIIAGTGSNSTDTAIYLSKGAQKNGADGLLVVTPYYNKATQKGMIGHFTAIAKSVDIPIIMYNIPGRTGCKLFPQTAVTLAKTIDNIVGMKEATGDVSNVAQLMQLAEGRIDLYSGNDDQIVPLMSLGGKGVISVLSNIAPKQNQAIVSKFLEGDIKGSLELQLKYIPLINSLFSEVNPIPIKKAMNFMGMEVGSLRMPLTEMEPDNAEILKKEMKKVGLI